METDREIAVERNLKKKIVLFTSNFQGGIFQFTMHLALVLRNMGFQTIMVVPDQSERATDGNNETEFLKYQRYKNLLAKNVHSDNIAKQIIERKPDLVIFSDDGVVSAQVLMALSNKFKTIMYIHDVKPHLSRFSLYNFSKQIFRKIIQKKALNLTDLIVLLSENSYELFKKLCPSFVDKSTWMPIGAHIPEVDDKIPVEWEGKSKYSGYYLFFGRIDKYKGIINLLKAYNSITEEKIPTLLIAGGGEFQIKEKELILKNKNIVVINRFIQDGEMLYLMKHSRCIVLPYIEASQSGVIPIAYYFGVPVIISNVPGLSEFVENGKTGVICTNVQEIKTALLVMNDDDSYKQMSKGASEFHREKLNWDMNLKKCIEKVIENI